MLLIVVLVWLNILTREIKVIIVGHPESVSKLKLEIEQFFFPLTEQNSITSLLSLLLLFKSQFCRIQFIGSVFPHDACLTVFLRQYSIQFIHS